MAEPRELPETVPLTLATAWADLEKECTDINNELEEGEQEKEEIETKYQELMEARGKKEERREELRRFQGTLESSPLTQSEEAG